MRVCFPTEVLQGLDSPVYGHFGSAPGFVIVETDDMGVTEINNSDMHHAHGMCQPLKALGGHSVDAIVVGGIGGGALAKLQAQGISVYRALEGSVRENLNFIQSGKLPQFLMEHTCGGHHGGGGCGHH